MRAVFSGVTSKINWELKGRVSSVHEILIMDTKPLDIADKIRVRKTLENSLPNLANNSVA